jgi:hypothetical protein
VSHNVALAFYAVAALLTAGLALLVVFGKKDEQSAAPVTLTAESGDNIAITTHGQFGGTNVGTYVAARRPFTSSSAGRKCPNENRADRHEYGVVLRVRGLRKVRSTLTS